MTLGIIALGVLGIIAVVLGFIMPVPPWLMPIGLLLTAIGVTLIGVMLHKLLPAIMGLLQKK